MTRQFIQHLVSLIVMVCASLHLYAQPSGPSADVCICSGTPGGIAMAAPAAREGRNVVLANHNGHLCGKISQSFMNARPVIDGNDLAIIARSSIHAPNQCDADHGTFHRVKNFRSLALKITPEPED